ncbi:MAG: PRC-barrel domain-containing protein [bacterium]|nr:PRC-barrel domain-containing protein [bacterium]
MTVNTKTMVNVPVQTRSGTAVGKVASFNLDQTTGHLVTLEVKTAGLVAGFGPHLIVPWDAIVEMNEKLVVIADQMVKVTSGQLAHGNPMATPTMMKELP